MTKDFEDGKARSGERFGVASMQGWREALVWGVGLVEGKGLMLAEVMAKEKLLLLIAIAMRLLVVGFLIVDCCQQQKSFLTNGASKRSTSSCFFGFQKTAWLAGENIRDSQLGARPAVLFSGPRGDGRCSCGASKLRPRARFELLWCLRWSWRSV